MLYLISTIPYKVLSACLIKNFGRKRELGASPKRSGHCKQGIFPNESIVQLFVWEGKENMQICKPGNLLNTWGETSEESSVPVKNAFWLFVCVCFHGSRHFLSYGMLNVEERTIWRWHILNAQGLISCDGIRLTHAFPRFPLDALASVWVLL